ncbi:glycoside hydrolase family 15 protein [Rhizobium leucaenae]|uniref:Trehalase n=1 Tax=Rhizobium leucaenae TaxID=29450 RepID=A0A7W6ZZI6_9HYPH|nr:glycoside hydrolase family 15 protein [Rhizobium leucaenae]MBB4571490.1 GH15 family glucan-1,4-alpha-glucosidase [Rhizobium leucaenae]MBB6304811.1 GH15 family glucan-1,4-alpha-glucosidase [Rhizobium leucaenae]
MTSRAKKALENDRRPIADYGLIGNMISTALVGRDGSIDWLCLPRFDSPACFASLLGTPENGRWRIAPAAATRRSSRRYLPQTAVIETTFETEDGAFELIDFMPLAEDEERSDIVRIVRGKRGRVAVEMELVLRFNYGLVVPWVRRRDYGLSAVAGPDAVELHTQAPLEGQNMKTLSRFEVAEGESVPFTLSYHRSHRRPHFVPDRGEALKHTVSWWQEWSKRCCFDPSQEHWREAVVRSLITLKLLTFRPTGGIIAAPTTSLPETPGGERNWDYRYCWLRDSALTLYALLNAGYREEAEAWRRWLLRAIAGRPDQLRIMYGLAGERWLPEHEIPWLAGYRDSRPVRIGNGAAQQLQLDVFGEVLDTLHTAREDVLASAPDAWKLQKVLLKHLVQIWHEPDQGIWEMRGPARHFTHSKLMCWVSFDRAIKAVERFGLDGPVDRWRAERDAIHAEICAKGFDPQLGSFVQSYGSKALDASLLLFSQVGFLPDDHPRILGTVNAIERDLLQDGFVLRYRPEHTVDPYKQPEGTFLACSFWLADAYVMSKRMDKAEALFERLLSVRNDLGLLAEEYEPASGELLGNFPQAFSHVGLVNTAFNLVRAAGPARQRAARTGPDVAAQNATTTGQARPQP